MFQDHYDSQLNRFKESFLTEAARCGRTEEVASLIDFGASVDWSPVNEDTPLLAAVRNNHIDVATILIANGADIHRKTVGGNNALHLASNAGNEEMCALLVSAMIGFESRGALNSVNDEGLTPFDIAVEQGYWALGQTLKNISDTNSIGEGSHSSYGDEDENDDNEDDVEIRDRFLVHGSAQEMNEKDPIPGKQRKRSGVRWQHQNNALQKGEETSHLHFRRLIEENARLRKSEELSRQTCSDAADAILILEKRCKSLESEKHDFMANMKEALSSESISKLTLEELEEMEEQIRFALDCIITAKIAKLSEQVDDRTCVVCQAEPKTILLMPCRHLCICKKCSENDKLLSCPLCRRNIAEKIAVFS